MVDVHGKHSSKQHQGKKRNSMSGSNKWGWSSNNPALCNSHLGCPAILPQLSEGLSLVSK